MVDWGKVLAKGNKGKPNPPPAPRPHPQTRKEQGAGAPDSLDQSNSAADPDKTRRNPPPPPEKKDKQVPPKPLEGTQQVEAGQLLDSTNEEAGLTLEERIKQLEDILEQRRVAMLLMNQEILEQRAQIELLSKPAAPVTDNEVEEATRQYQRSDIEAIPEGTLREAGMNSLNKLRGDPNVTQRGPFTPDQVKFLESLLGQRDDDLERVINKQLSKRDEGIVKKLTKVVLGLIARGAKTREDRLKELVAEQEAAASQKMGGEDAQ
jgi:hypothetical protein